VICVGLVVFGCISCVCVRLPGVRLCFAELCVFASDLHVFPCVLLCFRVFVCDLRVFACVSLCFRVFARDLRVFPCVFPVFSCVSV